MRKFIVIEGLIGVGKTSLCRLLKETWGAKLVLEPADHNPFLANFYADPERFAFPAQMFYLATRYSQQIELRQGDLFTELVVSDYLYAKDRLFAEQTLEGDFLKLYDKFAHLLVGSLRQPEFVVFLESPIETILKRIKRRAIDAEVAVSPEYLQSLRDRYYALWDSWNVCPIYILNTQQLNYVDNPADSARVLQMIRGWLDGTPTVDAPGPYHPLHAADSQLALL